MSVTSLLLVFQINQNIIRKVFLFVKNGGVGIWLVAYARICWKQFFVNFYIGDGNKSTFCLELSTYFFTINENLDDKLM